MLNKTALGEYFTGLVILTKAIPDTLTDADGDPVRDCIEQTLHDAADELELGQEVNWNAQGAPADVVPVDRRALARVQSVANELALVVEAIPQDGGARDD